MNPENQTSRPELSRKQKLARRFVPLALVASGAAGYGITETTDRGGETENQTQATAMAHAGSSIELGGAESGWGHEAAEKAIQDAVREGLAHASVLTSESSQEPLDIETVMAELPVYEQADQALEMAGYNAALPDAGDVLTVEVDVTVSTEKGVSYEVTDAQITDIPNNQS